MRIGLVRIVIIAVVVIGGIGAYLFRDRLSANAGELKVGDCFDDPATAAEVSDVQHQPCTEAHTAEVIYLGKLPDGDGSFPTDVTVQQWVSDNCIAPWSTYTGKSIDTETTLGLHFYQPTSTGWGKGDRGMICYAIRSDSATMTTSVKAAP
jgi:Septum formation